VERDSGSPAGHRTELAGTEPGIKTKAVRAVGWNGMSMICRQVFVFVTTAVLARLLLPSDFGLVGMAAIVTGLVSSVRELGLSAAIVQRSELDNLHLTSSFWANLAGGVALFGVCAAVAPAAARFFRNPTVAPILIVSSLGLVISSLGIVHRASLLRRLDFKAVAIAEIGASVTYGVSAIIMARMGLGVWSMVYGTLLGSTAGVVLWWTGFRWVPAFRFSRQKFLDLFRFGANVMGSGLVGYFNQNVDYLFVGRRLGASPLGIYTLAFKLMSFPLTRISFVVTDVTFPAYSRIQEDDARLRRAYAKTLRYISLFTFPLLFGLVMLAPEFVRVVYGTKWSDAILPLQIMCALGMLKSVGTTVGSVLRAKGRPDIELKFGLLYLIGMVVAVFVGSNYGIVGVALAITLLSLVAFPLIQFVTNRLIRLPVGSYLASIGPAFLASCLMAGVVALWKWVIFLLFPANDILTVSSSVAVGALFYVILLKAIRVEETRELPSLLVQLPILDRFARDRSTEVFTSGASDGGG
jgi:O-antigen/teichoic acid export membrane protein